MARLGFRGGWTPPPPFEFPPAFRTKAEKAIANPFPKAKLRELEKACNNFILARTKAAKAAEFGPTRDVLTEWSSHFHGLDQSLEREDINTMAAWMALARQSDNLRGINLPKRHQFQSEIHAMALLAQRALVDLKEQYPDARGQGRDGDYRNWIRAIAKIVEEICGSIWQGRRLDRRFCKLIDLLRSELRDKVHLMSQEAVLRIAREVLRSSE